MPVSHTLFAAERHWRARMRIRALHCRREAFLDEAISPSPPSPPAPQAYFIAGKQCDVKSAPLQRGCISIQDRVRLGMHDVRILCIEGRGRFTIPGEFIISTSSWKTIIAHSYYSLLTVYDACTHLRRRILGSHRAQIRNRHEKVIPTKVIAAFRDR